MYKFFILTFILTFSSIISSFSQRPEKPQKVKPSDFSLNTNSPQVLYHRALVTFPFKEDKSNGHVTDKQFTLSIEFISRIYLSKSSCNKDFILLSKIFNSIPIIQSIDYYHLDNNKIKKSQIKNSELNLESNDVFYYANFSPLIKDSIAIIDLSYSMTTEKKDFIVLLNTDNVPLHDMKVKIDIPEIYTYKNLRISDCLNSKKINEFGILRGYQLANSSAPITGEILADIFKKQFPNANYKPVYFNIKSTLYTWNDSCSLDNSIIPTPILSLCISEIKELK
jgi:hypothetical protein